MGKELQVLYEDNHIIIVNKAVSDIVQKDQTGDVCLAEKVQEYIKDKYQKPGNVFVGIPHRLDRPVSGVVVFARTSKALSRLSQMFKNKTIVKTYLAVVKAPPPKESDLLTHFIVRNTKMNKSFAHDRIKNGSKEAQLKYNLILKNQGYNVLEIGLMTGRHHQIRCQLAKIGCPIRGDIKYGYVRPNKDGGINLHARKVEFIHPVSKANIKVTAPLPNEKVWNLVKEMVE